MDNISAESGRCLHCKKPGCKEACPIGNDLPSFLRFVKNGDYVSAVKSIGHPFGEICGYVCPHDKKCQGGCVLHKRSESLNIGEIERRVFEMNPYKVERLTDSLRGVKIAVVGGGVSGITFAVKTYEAGADVTVFEKDKLLSTLKLIPSFRLPYDAIRRVENGVKAAFETVYKTVDYEYLKTELQKKFDVVYVATGALNGYCLGIEGEEFATDYKLFLQSKQIGSKVAVIGGGNSAIDCARLAKRQGNEVWVAYRRTESDMPAFKREIEDAKRDGVKFIFNAAPQKLQKNNCGLVLTLAKTVSEGRGKLEITDELFDIVCDCAVSATGGAFDKSILGKSSVDFSNQLQFDNVWLGGDAKGGKLVADAVADGICAARRIIEEKR